ncbi:MAG: chemotaxis protein CheA [Proteobacteria bacterium]|nr:chemotaxis protein CheA [Pseudomonadota bacterium]
MSNPGQHNQTYRVEAEELLAEIEETVLELEENPEDKESINRLFRAMHTIKGSGAMFGFDDVADFTHHVETVLDRVREGELSITNELINLILQSRDHITAILEAGDTGQSVDKASGDKIIERLSGLLPDLNKDKKKDKAEASGKKDGFKEMTCRIRFQPNPEVFTSGMDPVLLIEELRELGDCTVVSQTRNIPSLDSLNPEHCYFFWDIILTTARGMNAVEDVFIFVMDDCDISIEVIGDDSENDEQQAYKKLGEILVERKDISIDDLTSTLGKQKRIGEMLVDSAAVPPNIIKSAIEEQRHIKQILEKRRESLATSTIRVPAIKMDSLLDLVGELVTAQASLAQKASLSNDPELVLISEEIERLVAGLRDDTMSIRMIQIGSMFTGFKRLVRDLSKEMGKDIALVTHGEETELDKTVIERMKDPMIHIIRNSIDHGIEKPDQRELAKKPRQGTLTLEAEHSGAHVLIRITDDGKGLDPDGIRKKAVEKGLIAPDVPLTEKEIIQLVFLPGFSTAQTITEVSGRGVGMDVVKRNIESLRGSVDIESKKGKGTIITLKLPLTLAIIEGLMVMIGKDRYILPLSAVEECVELPKEEKNRIAGRRILNVRGDAVPYINLREKFEFTDNAPPLEQIVITEVNGERIGFVVDEVIGSHQTVIKSLGPAFKHARDISGATILGDGSVALILDVNKLV